MDGTVAHVWDRRGFPSKVVDPTLMGGRRGVLGTQLSSISLIEALTMGSATGVIPGGPAQFRDKTFGYVDWDDRVLWQWGDEAPGGNALQHHDWGRLGNGDTLVLSSDARTLPGFGDRKMTDDVIYEVDQAGRTVWTWRASDHLDQFGFTPAEMDLLRHAAAQDYLHVNDMQVLGPNRWAERGDNRFAPGNIMISSRDANIVAIIDRTTGRHRVAPRSGLPAPRLRLQAGDDAATRSTRSPASTTPTYPDGLPGAGNILLLDNQGEAGYPPQSSRSPAAPACSRSIPSRCASSGSIRATIAAGELVVLDALHRQRATPAERQHADRRRHRRTLLPGDARRRTRLGSTSRPTAGRRRSCRCSCAGKPRPIGYTDARPCLTTGCRQPDTPSTPCSRRNLSLFHVSAMIGKLALRLLRGIVRPSVEVTPAPAGIVIEWNVPVRVRDGTVLRVNVFRPRTSGPVPVIMSAHPYGKDKIPAKTWSGRTRNLQARLVSAAAQDAHLRLDQLGGAGSGVLDQAWLRGRQRGPAGRRHSRRGPRTGWPMLKPWITMI